MNTFPVTGLPAWQQLMRQGVDAARCGSASLAEGFYQQAMAIAQALIDGPAPGACADDRIAAFVVTHLNLADLHSEEERPDDAIAVLCAAHRRLMTVLRDPDADPALQLAACRHSRETHAALLAHLGERQSHPAIVAALHAGCLPFPMPTSATVH